MNELIGLKNINSLKSLNDIKQELLIFDKLFIVGLQEWKEVIEEKKFKDSRSLIEQKGLISLNDFVIYQGYLVMYEETNKLGGWDKYYDKSKTEDLEFRNQNLDYLIQEGKILYDYKDLNPTNKFTETHKQISPIIESKLKESKTQTAYDFLEVCNLCHDLKTRIISTSYNESKYTAIPCDNSIYNIDNITNVKAEVYNLVLEDFPIVKTDNVSWEQIFNFKNDPEIYNSIWGLRNWITNISKSNKSISEIEEEYRYLKYKYEQAIKVHKLKTGNSIFQTTIQTSAELLENVAKLRFRKLTDLLFKFKENRISLMETELKSDGNQFSYLFKVKDNFK
ncbi:hypothetical protein [Flavobacterium columnare]|uniref:Uncharacterized protein n=1 Tax=Flavobacterium columnare (strain ATCC 49512 / CIP 103533 / TG 44/87) TaxID=1041826 RepID=G8XA83_FLACA|nr:hypothetical protein [Flavobacterium columnare]AEW85941.1 hypothetical protein FCOL_05580 [Flavobacterium columnare ATCC 49512]PTD16335.1 hypothetical protein C6N29_01575 [Flavobacterium columnare]